MEMPTGWAPRASNSAAEIAEVTGLLGAARAHCRGVEEEYDGSVVDHCGERAVVAVLILQREVVGDVVFLHRERLSVEAKADTADGDQVARTGRILFNFLSQALDVGVERARVGELEPPPQRVEADLTRDNLPEVELRTAQADRTPCG